MLAVVMCLSFICTNASYAVELEKKTDQVIMQDILVESNDDRYIVVSIPQSEADEYRERLATDSEFRRSEILQALGSQTPVLRAYPPGRIIVQKYLYKKDIKAYVDAASGSGTFDRWLALADFALDVNDISDLVRLSKEANAVILAAKLFGILTQWTMQYQEMWWKEAYRDIIKGTISAVRYTIIENTTEYPKIWRIFERV